MLCLVTDRFTSRLPLPEAVARAVRGGADWIQVRERGLEGQALLELVEALARAAREAAEEKGREVRVIVNRRIDIALAAGADGAHLGGDALPPSEARALLGNRLVGVSAHASAEVAEAARAGADYAHLAPIFPPLSKAVARPPLGSGALREAARAGIPVLAQGGIEARTAGEAIAAGAAGVAVTGTLLAARDPEGAARALRAVLDATTRPEPTA